MRMSDWSSDVCSSDLLGIEAGFGGDHAMWFACEPLEARNHFAVRNLTRGILILDQAEICTPARIDRLGIVEELFVVRLDIRRVGAVDRRRFNDTLILADRHCSEIGRAPV